LFAAGVIERQKVLMKKKVLAAMSGGVDSSVTAALLLQQGFDVTGATFRMFPPHENAPDHLSDAKKITEILGINHIVFDFSDIFRKNIIDYFIKEYEIGRTPNPCVVCNRKIKFGAALERALEMGFDYLATGHYVRVEHSKDLNRYLIKKAFSNKDQSYCLYSLSQCQLSHAVFPLAGFEKPAVREIAKKMGLPVHNKPDSQDVCFISGNYFEFIKNNIKDSKSGNFIDEQGNILGKHDGIFKYTVGQRKGLGISLGHRVYVTSISHSENTVTLGLMPEKDHLEAEKVNFIPFDRLENPIKCMARTRYNCKETPVTVVPNGDNRIIVNFESKIKFISPGQSVVFYDDDVLIGGGIII
jgi:tRNA-specific 2-thiouridylase